MDMEFTDDEIREELARLGYRDVPQDKLAEFKKDLMKLIFTERSKSNSLNSSGTEHRDEEDEEEDETPSPSGIKGNKCSSEEFVTRNFTNHGSQWLGAGEYRENWHYRGQKVPSQRSASAREVPRVPGSYGLFELPISPEVEEDGNNCRDDVSDCGGKGMKRKTSRKTSDGCRRVDESLSENDTEGIFEIYERIRNLAMRDCECGKTRPTSADAEAPYRIKGRNKTPSVIMRKPEHPHTRNLVRCKPNERLSMYRKMWKQQPAVGDTTRDDLRKQMHSRLLKKYEIQLDKKVYIPNTYVVPSEKTRQNLRWKVRHALENYEMPPTGVFHEM